MRVRLAGRKTINLVAPTVMKRHDGNGKFQSTLTRQANETTAIATQGVCVVLSGREDRSFVTHRGSTALFCREDIDVPRLLESSHVHVGKRCIMPVPPTSKSCRLERCPSVVPRPHEKLDELV